MRVTCSCGQILEIDAVFAGRVAQCPACQKSFVVPLPSSMPAPTPPAATPGPAAVPPWPAAPTPAPQDPTALSRLRKLATAALVCGISSLAVYLVVFVILVVIGQDQKPGRLAQADAPLGASLAAILLSMAALALSIVAIACGHKGRKPANTSNRGTGLAGMILGIIGASISACCFGLFAIGFVIGLGTALKGM